MRSGPHVDRDLSWLDFDARVLNEAFNPSNSPLQRARFLSIAASNLEEFIMVRVPALLKAQGPTDLALDKIDALMVEMASGFSVLGPLLRGEDHFIYDAEQSTTIADDLARVAFEKTVLASPHSVGQFRIDLSDTLRNGECVAVFPSSGLWVRLNKNTPPVVRYEHETGVHYFFLDQLVRRFLGGVHGIHEQPVILRLIRDADLYLDLEAEDAVEYVSAKLTRRDHGDPVVLQASGDIHTDAAMTLVAGIQAYLRLDARRFFPTNTSIFLGALKKVLPRSHMVPKPYVLQEPMLDRIDRGDLITHYPYDSFGNYVRFLEEASYHPEVTKIWQTVYRLDESSPIVPALLQAARSKEVGVIIELRARFDEKSNIDWANKLAKAAVNTKFGFDDLKMHAKLSQVTRRMPDGTLRRYTHLSTGNFNANTAQFYTDLSLYTTDAVLGEDVAAFFEATSKEKVPRGMQEVLLSPVNMHDRMTQLVDGEIALAQGGYHAYIFIKVNALVDPAMVTKLYEASQAGVKIDLLVRGACSLVPGIRGISDNIQVMSIVDHFLEHSRIYFFGGQDKIFLSSADWMPRSFFSRLEVAFPVEDEACRGYIYDTISAYLSDTTKAWRMDKHGRWQEPAPGGTFRAQSHFEGLAATGYVVGLRHTLDEQ